MLLRYIISSPPPHIHSISFQCTDITAYKDVPFVMEEDPNDCCMLSLDVSWHDRANSMMTLLAARRIHLLIRFLPLYLNPINKHPLKFHFLQHP